MGRRSREHRDRVIAGLEAPFRVQVAPLLVLRCRKCGARVTEGGVTEHLKACQPQGAPCGKCGHIIMAENFLSHFKACPGKLEQQPPKTQPGGEAGG